MDQPAIPIIDLAPFLSGDPACMRQVAAAVNDACSEIGFLVVTGHGIDPELPERVFATARGFFDLPMEEKRKVRKEDGASGSGYHLFATEANAFSHGVRTPEDLRESFGLGRPDRRSGSYNRWPEHPAALKDVALDYYFAMERLGYAMARLFALALGLPEDYFAPKIDRHDSMMMIHHYPEQQTAPLPGQLRSGAHSDIGLFTMLRTEREHRPGGLQLKNRADEWVDVPAIQNSFIINIGDTMMRWTNDRWVSTLHRVVNPPRDVAAGSRRISMPVFFNANDDTVIECLPGCQSADNPPKYPPVNAGEYRRAKLRKSYDYARLKAEAAS